MQQQGALGVRARGEILAHLIDETAAKFERPRILSIACGHLREGVHSRALTSGRVGEFVALDQDADSLAEVERQFAGMPVRTMNCSVRSILAGKVNLAGFHFVYAAGLYDYLSERVAQRLTKLMFDMVLPGGRVLVANFAPVLPEVGYMETFMAWKLIYRTPEEMARLTADVPGSEWSSHRVFWDESENIVFLDMVKRSAKKPVNGKVTVPGLAHVSFGPAVRPPQPAETTSADETN
jgi:extracellular factor (EF) 3-hydroxypalmitic acid methyl ester biosynthesis protein